jgi:acetyltransferase-like isoleucine patch superfamily enzyme
VRKFFPQIAMPREGDGKSEPSRLDSFRTRLGRAWEEETRFDPRKLVTHVVSRAFPQFSFSRTRTFALRAAGVQIGPRSGILGPLSITGTGDVRELFSVGEDTFISGPLQVDLGAEVRIGSRVQLGHHVLLLTINHDMGPSRARCGPQMAAPIRIGDGVWIASRVTVLPGVTIGDGSVVAAGAVVSRDVGPNTLVAGVPARLVRILDDGVPPRSQRWSTFPPSSGYPPAQDGP